MFYCIFYDWFFKNHPIKIKAHLLINQKLKNQIQTKCKKLIYFWKKTRLSNYYVTRPRMSLNFFVPYKLLTIIRFL